MSEMRAVAAVNWPFLSIECLSFVCLFVVPLQQTYPSVHAIGYISVACVIVYVICFAAGLGMIKTHSSYYLFIYLDAVLVVVASSVSVLCTIDEKRSPQNRKKR